MYKNKEEALAYARAHYAQNKKRYNPGRSNRQEVLREAKKAAPHFAEQVLKLSETRFVYPDELPCLCADGFGPTAMDALYETTFTLGWLPEEAKTHGLFLRRPPFAYHPNSTLRRRFLSQLALIPQSKRGVRAENLVLTLILKEV